MILVEICKKNIYKACTFKNDSYRFTIFFLFDVASADVKACTLMRPFNVGEALYKINTASPVITGTEMSRNVPLGPHLKLEVSIDTELLGLSVVFIGVIMTSRDM